MLHAQHYYHFLVEKVVDKFKEILGSKEYYQEDGIKLKKQKRGQNRGQYQSGA